MEIFRYHQEVATCSTSSCWKCMTLSFPSDNTMIFMVLNHMTISNIVTVRDGWDMNKAGCLKVICKCL